MANTFVVSRNHLIFGLCLPIAVLLGYILAEPLDSGSLAVLVMVVSVLFVPLMMKWHYVALILSWNSFITPIFLPGHVPLWIPMVWLSLFFGLLARSISIENRFLHVSALNRVMLFLSIVVVATAFASGGFGFRSMGSESQGGKRYLMLLTAIAGYYALSSQAIPPHRARLYVSLFLLSGLTSGISNLAYMAGPKFYFLYSFFPVDLALGQATADASLEGESARITGLLGVSQALTGFVLARHGVAGLFDFARPWRLGLLVAAVAVGALTGFRSCLILFGLTFLLLFWLEGLWKTRYLFMTLAALLVAGVVVVTFVERMPLSVQRTLSFLPINTDAATRAGAESSIEWRQEMWRNVLPEVPRYLFKGKGYALNLREIEMIEDARSWGVGRPTEGSELAGDYHNGPLSVLIPFGIYGVVAVLWFWFVAIRVLYRNYRQGNPALRNLNAFLLAAFVTRVIFFLFAYGSFNGDLAIFAGLLGMSVALNRGVALQPAEAEAEALQD